MELVLLFGMQMTNKITIKIKIKNTNMKNNYYKHGARLKILQAVPVHTTWNRIERRKKRSAGVAGTCGSISPLASGITSVSLTL